MRGTGIHVINKFWSDRIILVKYVKWSVCLIALLFTLLFRTACVCAIVKIKTHKQMLWCGARTYVYIRCWCRSLLLWAFYFLFLKSRSVQNCSEIKCDHDWGFGSIARGRHFLHSFLSHLGQKAKIDVFSHKTLFSTVRKKEKTFSACSSLGSSLGRTKKSGVSQIFWNSHHHTD